MRRKQEGRENKDYVREMKREEERVSMGDEEKPIKIKTGKKDG